jgi:hypothetical protein
VCNSTPQSQHILLFIVTTYIPKIAMSKTNVKAFQHVLQHGIQLEDSSWSYHVPNLPRPSTTNLQQLIKSIALVSNSVKQQVVLRIQVASINRAISTDPLDRFIIISFADFRLRVPQHPDKSGLETQQATARESADYIVKLLRSGVTLNEVHYNFYGHSNSQLKSRTCFLYAAPKPDISQKVESLGDFTKMKTVAKKSKRIGLLFSVAQVAMTVDPGRCQDISDIETNDYIFTDGCGLISPHLARELSRKVGITFRNIRYTPSVFQIRYRGYKGVVMVDPTMKGEVLVKFRKSMKKFSGGSNCSFSVVDHSKVFNFVLVCRYQYYQHHMFDFISLGIAIRIWLSERRGSPSPTCSWYSREHTSSKTSRTFSISRQRYRRSS